MTKSTARTIATVFAVPALLVAAAGIALLVVLAFAMQDKHGDDLAAENVDRVARALAEDLSGIREPTDAETVAADWFHSRSARVEPLTWTGSASPDQAATIEARISADVAENSIGGYYGPFNSAGTAARCYRYTVTLGDDARFEVIPCNGLPTPSAPPSSNRPVLPDDAAARIERILASAPESGVADVIRAEFPGEEFTIDTTETAEGELIVAVGVKPGTDCVLRVRKADGEVLSPSYDQTWLEPGELGCSTRLYSAPPT